jgi:hypothetical protein
MSGELNVISHYLVFKNKFVDAGTFAHFLKAHIPPPNVYWMIMANVIPNMVNAATRVT